jgi:hypothetical protein
MGHGWCSIVQALGLDYPTEQHPLNLPYEARYVAGNDAAWLVKRLP